MDSPDPMMEPTGDEAEPTRQRLFLDLEVPWLYLCLNLLVLTPFTLFYGNADDFNLRFGTLAQAAPGIWLAGALSLAPAIFFPTRWVARLAAILWSLVILTWVQSRLLPFEFGALDGTDLDWSGSGLRTAYEGVLWLGLLLLAFWIPRKALPALRGVGHVAVLTQLFLAGVALTDYPEQERIYEIEPPPPSVAEYSSTRNVVYIILDEFSSEVFGELMEEREALREAFAGFTHFAKNTGLYPTTRVAVPALLTSEIYDNDTPISKFKRQVYGQSIGSHLHEQGYVVDELHLQNGMHLDQINTSYVLPFPYVSREGYVRFQQAVLLDLSLFRSLPDPLKRLVHAQGSWTVRRLPIIDAEPSTHFLPSSSMKFARQHLDDMVIVGAEPRFKYFHLGFPHTPIVMDEECNFLGRIDYTRQRFVEQSLCALRMMARWFDRWKEMGIFDSMSIVISSDHGHRQAPRGFQSSDGRLEPRIMGGALALLAAKPAHAGDDLLVSPAPSSLLDVAATLAWLADADPGEFNGRPAFEISPEETRVRHFFHYEWRQEMWGYRYLPPMDHFVISGDPFRESSWEYAGSLFPPSLESEADADVDGSRIEQKGDFVLDLGKEEARPYLRVGWSEDEVSPSGRDFVWAMGSGAVVRVPVALDSSKTIEATVLNHSFNSGQSITVEVNGQPIDTWEIERDQTWLDLRSSIPSSISSPEGGTIHFRFEKYRQATPDTRRLSVVFDRIRIDADPLSVLPSRLDQNVEDSPVADRHDERRIRVLAEGLEDD